MCFCTKTFCSFLSTDSSVSWSVVAVLALLDVFSVCQSVVPRWGEAWARSGLCCPFLWECGGGTAHSAVFPGRPGKWETRPACAPC